MVFIDNVGVIHMIVNGTSKDVELGAITRALHFRLAVLKSIVWWEYVASPSNIADGGSRVGISCKLAHEEGISLRTVSFNDLPFGFPFTHPSSWLPWWTP